MAGKRRYEDGCALAQGLDLVGERWALLVVRELMFGPKRFTDLRQDLPGIATNILTQRLVDLEAAGLVTRRELPPPGRAMVYELSAWGRELGAVFKVMGRWAARSPQLNRDWPLSVNGAVLSLASMFDPARAQGVSVRLHLILSARDFLVEIADGRLDLSGGAPDKADVTVRGHQEDLVRLLYDPAPCETAARDTGMEVEGDRAALTRAAACFRPPDQAPGPAPGPQAGQASEMGPDPASDADPIGSHHA